MELNLRTSHLVLYVFINFDDKPALENEINRTNVVMNELPREIYSLYTSTSEHRYTMLTLVLQFESYAEHNICADICFGPTVSSTFGCSRNSAADFSLGGPRQAFLRQFDTTSDCDSHG